MPLNRNVDELRAFKILIYKAINLSDKIELAQWTLVQTPFLGRRCVAMHIFTFEHCLIAEIFVQNEPRDVYLKFLQQIEFRHPGMSVWVFLEQC